MSVRTVVTCPECGSPVSLSVDPTPGRSEPTDDQLSRMAHAVCGCYVFSMSSGTLARLFASLQTVDAGDDKGQTV
jgi:hypothetical protein